MEQILHCNFSYTDGKSALFAYDKNGNLTKVTDWNGVTTFGYDALSRLAEVTGHNNRTTEQ